MTLIEVKLQGSLPLSSFPRTRDSLGTVFIRPYGFIILAKKDILTTPPEDCSFPFTGMLRTASPPV